MSRRTTTGGPLETRSRAISRWTRAVITTTGRITSMQGMGSVRRFGEQVLPALRGAPV